jgi:hypothetical protein
MNAVFAEKLGAALKEVTAAEDALGEVLREIEIAPRAEKKAISDAVSLAFERLRIARRELIELQELAAAGD